MNHRAEDRDYYEPWDEGDDAYQRLARREEHVGKPTVAFLALAAAVVVAVAAAWWVLAHVLD